MWIKNIGIGDPGGKPPIPTAEIAPNTFVLVVEHVGLEPTIDRL